jgi:hypothetical protein
MKKIMHLILAVFVIMVFIITFTSIPCLLNSINNISEYIYVFPTFDRKFILGYLAILGVYGAGISTRKRFLAITIVLCQFFVWSISYGYITEEGIIYRCAHNLYVTKTISWENVQSPVTITIDGNRRSFSYTCDLTLKENDNYVNFDLFGFIIESEVKAKVPDLIKVLKKHNVEINIVETDSAKSRLKNNDVEDIDFIQELESLSMN